MNIKENNLFKFAKSELSQDAFLCWLLSWAHPDYKKSQNESEQKLHLCADELLRRLFKLDKKEALDFGVIENLEIKTQFHNIDIFCHIENTKKEKYGLIIEDKINAKESKDQLKKYYALITEGIYNPENGKKPTELSDNDKKFMIKKEDLMSVYFKTGNEIKNKDRKAFKPFWRKEFLNILKQCECDNDIFNDYKKNLNNIEKETNEYENLPIKEWKHRAWEGFFMNLEKMADKNETIPFFWEYVSNKSGGFQCFCWNKHPFDEDGFSLYPQIEAYHCKEKRENKIQICIKINTDVEEKNEKVNKKETEERKKIKRKAFEKIVKLLKKNKIFSKPKKLSYGVHTSTLAIYKVEILENNLEYEGLKDILNEINIEFEKIMFELKKIYKLEKK